MRKRILYYSDEPFFGGSEKRIKNLLNDPALQRKYKLFFSYRYSKLYQKGVNENIDINIERFPIKLPDSEFLAGTKNILAKIFIRLPLRLLKEFYFYFIIDIIKIYFCIKKIKPDIVHINSGGFPTDGSCPSAAIAAGLARVEKIFFNVNNIAFPYRRYRKWIERPLDRLIERYATLFITSSKEARAKLSSIRGIRQDKVINIYTSMEKDIVINRPPDKVRAEFGLEPDQILIGCAARLYKGKGNLFLIKAARLLKEEAPLLYKDIKIVIAGEGPEERKLRRQIDKDQLNGNFLLAGFYKNIFSFINACDIIVLPSIYYEDFPSVILEAMHFAKPIIGTKVGGIPEQIIDGVSGLLIEPNSAEQLQKAILRLAKNKDLRDRLGSSAQEKLKSDFSYTDFIKSYSGLYKD